MTMRPPMPSVLLSRRAKIALSVVAILIVLIVVLVQFSGIYINYLWFGSVGHRNVYSTVLWTRVSLFFIFGVLMALILGGNMFAAYRIRPPFRPMSAEQQNLQNYVLMVEPRRKLLLVAIMIITFFAAGASSQGDWQIWQLWLHGSSFGQADPQFNRDISFYAWDYPAYRLMLSFGFTAVIVSLLLTIAIHYVTGAIRLQTPGPKITLAARRHLTILVFVFMALKAVAYWLDRYGFVFSERSKFTGASYTDVHSALPAKTILFWIAIVLAIGVLASLWLRSALFPGIGFVVLLVLSILIGGIYPAIVQKVSVNPNASDKEAPYISRNINATRQAYDIVTARGSNGGTVQYVSYPATSKPSGSAVGESNATTNNIRILDPNVVSPTFLNLQRLGVPYAFSPRLSVDRYTENNDENDYIVGVRVLAPNANQSGSQRNWINLHTVYTHGYGLVAARANEDVTNGTTGDFTQGGIPANGPLNNSQPQVYYSSQLPDYSIVGAKGKKREHNAGDRDPNVTYAGKGGVSLSNPFTKFAFAVDYRETNFILNDAVGAPGAKIVFNRDPKRLLQKVAPFLTVDGAPYPFVNSKTGHVMWMLDGYTTMANYPYSQRSSLSDLTHTSLQQGQADTQINYIRNSVKATVDAYDGTVKLYQWDQQDPVLKAWMNVFPGLVHKKSTMPAQVVSHIRYPQDLFDVQRGLLAQYHITKPTDSYNGKGKWAVPADPFADSGNQPSYYVLATPPTRGADTSQFQLTSPMVVSGGNNLASFISADSDPGPNYGRLTVLQATDSSNVQGPAQIANVFKSNAKISEDISLLSQGQSSVLHGNLLTLPLGNSFLYVEPLYVQSTSRSSYPTLQRVLVTYGDKIGYAATLSAALNDIETGAPPGSSITLGETTGQGGAKNGTPSGTPSSSSGSPTQSPTKSASSSAPPKTQQQLLTRLAAADDALGKAYDSKDPVKIAQAQKELQQLVEQLLKSRSSTPTSPRSTPKATHS